MKIKSDFVTNSSSSSFCAWGVTVEPSQLIQEDEVLMETLNEKFGEGKELQDFVDWMREEPYELVEMLEQLVKGTKLSVCNGPESTNIYIGIHPTAIPLNMTIQEALDETKQELAKIGIEEPIAWIEEAWMDG